MIRFLFFILFSIGSFVSFSQNFHPKFKEYLKTNPETITSFCIKKDPQIIEYLIDNRIKIKYTTKDWIFISTNALWIQENLNNGRIKQLYFESSPAVELNDTVRLTRFVDQVHSGSGGLTLSYTGKNVVVGIVDNSINFNHPDFKDANGKTRILRIWDQTGANAGRLFNHYGYGQLWDSTDINAGLCTQATPNPHGTHVSGIAAGNGLACGKNKGMAPDAKIVMVSNNGASQFWASMAVDGCDYIFKFADSLGLPAVVNISVGSYWGSHDGKDPNTQALEQLLDEKAGRIVVTAAGNSGDWPTYHVTGNVLPDTSFVWINNNATNVNPCFFKDSLMFDLYADTAEAHFDFAFGVDKPAPNYGFRGSTIFRNTLSNLNTWIYDTIWNGSNRIARLRIGTEIVNGSFHLQLYSSNLDSSTYKLRFMTRGNGKYDLWSMYVSNGNSLETILPSPAVIPEIVNYQMPDNLQTIVTGFQCSPKVITVGSIRNRAQHTNKNGNISTSPAVNSPGNLAINSSRGPSRNLILKPDITANGELVLSAGTTVYLANPNKKNLIDIDNWHYNNWGTSMASPVVAGIAALYLDKCPNASYSDFKKELINTATSSSFTGTLPNFSYGNGHPHALNLLLGSKNIPIVGNTGICSTPVDLNLNTTFSNVDSVIWSNGVKTATLTTSTPSNYSAKIYYGKGCVAQSDTLNLVQYQILPSPIITDNTGVVTSNYQPNYQWFLNGNAITNENKQLLFVSPPYGSYNVSVTSVNGCVSNSNIITINAGIKENVFSLGTIFPNPTTSEFSISTNEHLISTKLKDLNGKCVDLIEVGGNIYSISHLKVGTYFIEMETKSGIFHSKIIKM